MSKKLRLQGYNDLDTLDELPFTDDQKEMVLEWFAQKIWGGLHGRGHCKSYDPLIIEGYTAHSYIFNFEDGGRHHDFQSLTDLEKLLEKEMKEAAERYPEMFEEG